MSRNTRNSSTKVLRDAFGRKRPAFQYYRYKKRTRVRRSRKCISLERRRPWTSLKFRLNAFGSAKCARRLNRWHLPRNNGEETVLPNGSPRMFVAAAGQRRQAAASSSGAQKESTNACYTCPGVRPVNQSTGAHRGEILHRRGVNPSSRCCSCCCCCFHRAHYCFLSSRNHAIFR